MAFPVAKAGLWVSRLRATGGGGEQRKRTGRGQPAGQGAPAALRVLGEETEQAGLQRGQGCRMFGSTSVGSLPALSSRDAEPEPGSKRSVRVPFDDESGGAEEPHIT